MDNRKLTEMIDEEIEAKFESLTNTYPAESKEFKDGMVAINEMVNARNNILKTESQIANESIRSENEKIRIENELMECRESRIDKASNDARNRMLEKRKLYTQLTVTGLTLGLEALGLWMGYKYEENGTLLSGTFREWRQGHKLFGRNKI